MSFMEYQQSISLTEKGVLAAALVDAEIAGVVGEILEPSDFSEPMHVLLFEKIIEFYLAERVLPDGSFDIIQIFHSIVNTESGKIISINDMMEILSPDAVYANGDPIAYAYEIFENSRKNSLANIGNSISEASRVGSQRTSDDIVSYMQENVQNYSEGKRAQSALSLSDFMSETIGEIEFAMEHGIAEDTGIPTGFIDLDMRIGGLFPGQMIIIAGRPGLGKTTLALDFARNAALLSDQTSLIFSLEMGRKELLQKLLSAESHVEHKKIRLGQGLTAEDMASIKAAGERLSAVNIIVDDNPELDLMTLRSKCMKQMAKPEGLDLVIIDYLQLMKKPKGDSNNEQKVAEISRTLKILAKTLKVPIVVLAQLNRGSANRNDKVPVVSDLRESGSLEQDADTVLLVHRPEDGDESLKPGITEIIVGKVRAGERGTVDVMTLLAYSKFGNAGGRFAASEAPLSEEEMAQLPPDDGEDPFAGNLDDNIVVEHAVVDPRTPDDPYLRPDAGIEVTSPEGGGSAW